MKKVTARAGIALITRARLPRARDLGWIFACGFFGMIAYQLLLNWGQLFLPAGTAIIIIAAAPLAGVAFGCLARSGVSLSAAVRIVVAAMVVQGIYHPLQRPLLAKYRASRLPATR